MATRVAEVFIGYPKDITHTNGNEYNVAVWRFREFVEMLVNKLAEYGIKVYLVNEAYSSQTCSLCGQRHKGGRKYRGLYCCPIHKKCVNADINATVNLARWYGKLNVKVKKILSFVPTHNGITPVKRGNAQDLGGGTPAL